MGSPQHQAPCLVLPAVLLMLLASLLMGPAAAQTAPPDQGSSVNSTASSNRTKVPPVAIQYPTTPSGSGSASTPPGEASLDAPTTTTTPQLLPGPATPVTARNTSSGQVSAGAPPPAAQGEKSPEIPPPNPAFSPDPQQQEQEQPEAVGRGPLPPFDQIVVCAPLTVLVSPRGHSGDTRGAADPNSSSNNGSSTQARPVRVNGEEDVRRAVSWHVVGSTLYISTYGSFAADKLVKVTVYTPGDTLVSVTATGVARVVMAPRWPKLGNLRLSALGVASVVAPGLEVDSLEVVTQGTSSVYAAGTIGTAAVTISGTSRVTLAGVTAGVTGSVEGVSQLYVDPASDNVDVRVSASGVTKVAYTRGRCGDNSRGVQLSLPFFRLTLPSLAGCAQVTPEALPALPTPRWSCAIGVEAEGTAMCPQLIDALEQLEASATSNTTTTTTTTGATTSGSTTTTGTSNTTTGTTSTGSTAAATQAAGPTTPSATGQGTVPGDDDTGGRQVEDPPATVVAAGGPPAAAPAAGVAARQQESLFGLRTWKGGPLSTSWAAHPFPWFLPLGGTSESPGDDSNSNAGNQGSSAASSSQEGGGGGGGGVVSVRVGEGAGGGSTPADEWTVRWFTCDEPQEELLVLGA